MSLNDQLLEWHDFYTAVAGVSGVLLGLLFVALALNPAIMADTAPDGLRSWSGEVFHALLVMLVFSLLFLIPFPTYLGLAIPILILAATGFGRLARDIHRLRGLGDPDWSGAAGLQRFGWALAGYASATVVGLGLLLRNADFVDWMVMPIFLLLVTAAANCWDILKEVGTKGTS